MYTNDDLANLIRVQADRICQEVRLASETGEAAPSASTNNRSDEIAWVNEAFNFLSEHCAGQKRSECYEHRDAVVVLLSRMR